MGRYIRQADALRVSNASAPAEHDLSIYDSYGDSDGEYVVGELVDVRLPTGDWVLGAISEIQHFGGFSSCDMYIAVQVINGSKMWRIEVKSKRDIRIRRKMRPFSAWRKY